ELLVLNPGRMVDVERCLFEARFEDRRDVQPRGDHRLEVFEEVALIVVRQANDRHASDMHRHFRRFEIEKRGVQRRQLLTVTHSSLPQILERRLTGASRQADIACSGGAYAMANGPARSNGQNSPSGCATRSATAHSAAGFTPRPIWLARCPSMFSARSERRSRQVRQFTTPSARE